MGLFPKNTLINKLCSLLKALDFNEKVFSFLINAL